MNPTRETLEDVVVIRELDSAEIRHDGNYIYNDSENTRMS